jgi:hypothetical protein
VPVTEAGQKRRALSHGIYGYIRRHHLGLVAIFIALSGSAYAANVAKKNSVTTKSIRAGAVTGPKVGQNTLTGVNIDESTHGTVPDAAHLGGQSPSAFQARISGGCVAGTAISSVGGDGGVACTPTGSGTITGVTAGNGLSGGGSSGNVNLAADLSVLQHRLTAGCATNQALMDIDASGSPTCFTPTTTTQFLGNSAGIVSGLAFLPPSGTGSSAVETNVTGAVPANGTVSNLTVVRTNPPGPGQSSTLTLRVNGVDSSLSCTVSGFSSICTSAAQVSVTAGDRIDLEHTTVGVPAVSGVSYGFTITS